MFRILETRELGRGVKQFVIEAARIARKQKPGQFVIVRLHEHGERIPLTIADSDPHEGTITLVVQGIGKTTCLLNMLEGGDSILDIAGPLGKPSDVQHYGTAVVIGGGVGTAIALPTARALRQAGNYVISILGSRSRDLVILEDEVRKVSNETHICTDDGTYGRKGVVTDKLKDLLAGPYPIDFILAIGPVPMMRAVAKETKFTGVKTVVSLNSIMVDGTGMCGGCRVLVNKKNQFACVDGPEFEAEAVNFDVLMERNSAYRDKEQRALKELLENPEHELEMMRVEMKKHFVEEITGEPAAEVNGVS